MTSESHPLQILACRIKEKKNNNKTTAASVPRSLVASNVFTLMWGDCYFCTEPDNSIIHRGCWRTHFTFVRMEAGVFLGESALRSSVCLCARAPPAEDELLTRHTTQGERKDAKKKKKKGKEAVINMAIKAV